MEQVQALAPDAASVQAARRLSRGGPWSGLGSTGELVWGKFQGSAREPYQVTVDLTGPYFRCTCPSRKHPCKHGLGLLLMWVRNDGSVHEEAAAADFAGDWADDRMARAEAQARKAANEAAAGAKTPPDPEAQAKRLAEREALMTAGLDDFERWLHDLVRQGLAAARRQPYRYWDDAAARLVDAQMPGLAERVRGAGSDVVARADWAPHLLDALGQWFLVVRAWRRRTTLPPDVMGDLRTTLGWSRRHDEVLAGERVHDRWTVVGIREGGDEQLVSQRTWLHGETYGGFVIVLDFAHGRAPLRTPHLLGSVVEAEVALYPGSSPRRALFTGDELVVGRTSAVPGAGDVGAALASVATAVAANPWTFRLPVALGSVVPVRDGGGRSWVVDAGEAALPLAEWADPWPLLAVSGGGPVDVFAEWDDGALAPVACAVDGELVSL